MTKYTGLGRSRRFEMVDGKVVRRAKKIDLPPRTEEIDCGGERKFKIPVGVGQIINPKRMCKKLLSNNK